MFTSTSPASLLMTTTATSFVSTSMLLSPGTVTPTCPNNRPRSPQTGHRVRSHDDETT